MRKLITLFLLIFIIGTNNYSYSQLWKQYADSAKIYANQKNNEKAIELYYKAKGQLKTDSAETNTYARICDSLGSIYINKGTYNEAELLFLEAKGIREKVLGKNDPEYASSCHNLGHLYLISAQYGKAEPLLLEGKEIREKTLGKTNAYYASSCNNLATLYMNLGKYENAETLYLETKKIRETLLGKLHPLYADICYNLGLLYEHMGQNEKAKIFCLEAMQIREKIFGKQHIEYANSCNVYAILLEDLGEYDKALPLFLEVKQICERVFGKLHPDYADVCNNLANLYYFMGQFNKAEPLFLETKQIREHVLGKQHPDYASSCGNLASLYENMGKYNKAESLYLEAKLIDEKILGKKHPVYASDCFNLAIHYMDIAQYQKAELLFLEAKQIRASVLGKQHPYYAGVCTSLANLYDYMGQYKKAEPLYVEAKQIQERTLGKNHPEYANACNNLAAFYHGMGQPEKAELLYLETKEIREKTLGKLHPYYATSCYNLAGLYEEIGQYDKAEKLYLEAKEIQEKVVGKLHPEYASTCNNLAILYRDIGEYEKAEMLCIEAKKIRESIVGKEHPDYAASCNYLAIIYQNMGQYEQAEKLYLESKKIREKVLGNKHPDYADVCANLATLYLDEDKFQKAEPLYLDAKELIKNAFGNHYPSYGSLCSNMGRLYWAIHQPLKAGREFNESFSVNTYTLSKIFQFTSEKEKADFLKNILNDNGKLYSFYLSERLRSEQPYSVSLFHRNLVLSASQALTKELFFTSNTTIKDKYDKWGSVKEQLAFWYAKPIAERPDYVKDLEEQANNLEKELTRTSSEFKNQHVKENITWQAIQQNLKPNEAAIEFADFNFFNGKRYTDSTYYIALLLRKDKPEPQLIKLFEKKQLDSLLNNANDINALYQNTSVYKLTWKPIEKYLNGITKVYFAPSGNLFKISFAALPVNNEKVLSDEYQLVQLNTTASVTDKKENFITASDKLQLYGGIQYTADTTALKQVVVAYHTDNDVVMRSLPDDLERGGSIQYLPGTEKEVDDIKQEANKTNTTATILSGINATEESFKALSGKASPSVLHIATHGFFFPDPKQTDSIQRRFETSAKVFRQSDNPLFRSGLLFAGASNAWHGKSVSGIEDGIVTAYDVSNMYLPNTKLVVLSACETALGDIQGSEGVYGLQRAFKIAGIQNLVMSLWKVPDQETSEFMKMFYKNMFARQTISDAFYNAQSAMKNKYRTDPYKWAAWVLVR